MPKLVVCMPKSWGMSSCTSKDAQRSFRQTDIVLWKDLCVNHPVRRLDRPVGDRPLEKTIYLWAEKRTGWQRQADYIYYCSPDVVIVLNIRLQRDGM
jgi:hypothetical protein